MSGHKPYCALRMRGGNQCTCGQPAPTVLKLNAQDAKRQAEEEAQDAARAAERRRRREDPTLRERLLDRLEAATTWQDVRDLLTDAIGEGTL